MACESPPAAAPVSLSSIDTSCAPPSPASLSSIDDDTLSLLLHTLDIRSLVAVRCVSQHFAEFADAVLNDAAWKARELRPELLRGTNVAWRVATLEADQTGGQMNRGWMHSLASAGASTPDASEAPAFFPGQLAAPRALAYPEGGGRGWMTALDNAGANYSRPRVQRFGARRRFF